MDRTHAIFRAMLAIALSAAVWNGAGCASKPKSTPPPREPSVTMLRLKHHVGGAHHRTVVANDTWYQTLGSTLLVLPHNQTSPVKTVELGEAGACGPAVDMLIWRDRMIIVIQDDAVVELSLADPSSPRVMGRIDSDQLGILPRTLSVAGGEAYVSGRGGVVRWRDQQRVFTTAELVGRVTQSADGLIVSKGKQLRRTSDDRFVGSASELVALPDGFGGTAAGSFAFIRQAEGAAIIGLMSPDFREINAAKGTAAVSGTVRSARLLGDRLWIVSDSEVTAFEVTADAIHETFRVDVLGARDVAVLDRNHLAIAGVYGRAIYRMEDDAKGKGRSFVSIVREPSGLAQAASDGQNILAGSTYGVWMYLIGSRAELVSRQFEKLPPPPSIFASTVNASATVSQDGSSLKVSPSNGPAFDYVEPKGAIIRCVVAVEGDFWVGHDRGITVIHTGLAMPVVQAAGDPSSPAVSPVIERLRLEGPVIYMYPLMVGNGASFVSELGGFGVAELIVEPVSKTSR